MGERAERRLKLESEIRNRLECVCSELPKDDFDRLIEKIADNTIKSETRTGQMPRVNRNVRPDR